MQARDFYPASHVISKTVGSPFSIFLDVNNFDNGGGFARLLVGLPSQLPGSFVGSSAFTPVPANGSALLNASGPTSSLWPQGSPFQAEVRAYAGDVADLAQMNLIFQHTFTLTVT